MSAQSFQDLVKKEEEKIEPNFYCFDTDEQQYNILHTRAVSTEEFKAISSQGNRRQSRRNLRTTSMANLKFVDSESSQKTTRAQDYQQQDYIDNI